MTIAELRNAIAGMEGALEIEMFAPVEDEDGAEIETSFSLVAAVWALDPDTAEPYARFVCEAP